MRYDVYRNLFVDHLVTPDKIAIASADEARVSSQYSMTMRLAGDPPTYIEAAGWYDDTVVRTATGWRIANRYERIAYVRM